jgi:ATP-dependent helicase HrpB
MSQVAQPLPITPWIPEILARVRDSRAAVVTAAPGTGKTTQVPPALAADGPVILLQPRRVAARSIAARIAAEQGWTLGREVGWHVRLERRFVRDTRLLVATEGILTARLQQDPLLSGFRTIVLDEFHERSIHADLGIALARQAWLARDDLRLVVMSATLDATRVAAWLGDCPVVAVPGESFPLQILYRPDASLASGAAEALAATSGQVLCFLAGAPEIARALPEVTRASPGVDVVSLHGALPASEQDAAIAATNRRRIILSTNIAETSLTVPGVHAVVDTGLHKVARYDPDRAIDSLETERIAADSAEQRAGRAARLGPGVAVRLWHQRDRLQLHREPEIHRIDLSGPMLDILAWGGDPRTFEWFERPVDEAIAAGLELLERLGAVTGGQLTATGTRMQALPLHPRLARLLLEANGAWPAALACALLSERRFLPRQTATSTSDLLSAVDRERELPQHVLQTARVLQRSIGVETEPVRLDERSFRRAVFHAYPDRVGRRRQPGSPRVLLASGHGAALSAESGVREGDFVAAIDVQAAPRGEGAPGRHSLGGGGEARIRMASIVDREWLLPSRTETAHELDREAGRARAFRRDYYGAIVLNEHPVTPDPEAAAILLRDAYVERGWTGADEQLMRRLRFAGLPLEMAELLARATAGRTDLAHVDLAAHLTWDEQQRLDRAAPPRLAVPSGRTHPLEYHADGTVSASVKLQELFGLAETPRIGSRQEPVLLLLLAPNARPVQTTRDLRSFWERTYPEVRKELRGRYPKHPWPEDPWSAIATARTLKRR